jgi:hypothetical protein
MSPSPTLASIAALWLATATFVAMPAAAQVYKWVDANGVTHYGERPPPGSTEKLPRNARELDIPLTGNDSPDRPRGECYTIQCQYERMRADRLIREDAWRKDEEVRTRQIAEARRRDEAQRDAARPSDYGRWGVVGTPIWRPGVVVGGRPVFPRPPTAPPGPRGEPGVSILSPGER